MTLFGRRKTRCACGRRVRYWNVGDVVLFERHRRRDRPPVAMHQRHRSPTRVPRMTTGQGDSGFFVPAIDHDGRTHSACYHLTCAGNAGFGHCHTCDRSWPCPTKARDFR